MSGKVIAEGQIRKRGYLFVLPWDIASLGGVNQVVGNLYREMLGESPFRPLLLMSSWPDARLREQSMGGGLHAFFRLRGAWYEEDSVRTVFLFAFFLPGVIYTLTQFIRKYDVAVINFHYPTLGMLPFTILKWLGVFRGKLIISLHGADIKNAKAAVGVGKLLWRILFKSADAIVTCSVQFADDVKKYFPERAERIKPVHNGLDVDRLLAERDRNFQLDACLQDQNFLLSVAKFERKKGQDILLMAFRKLGDRYPELKLVMVGAAGPFRAELVDIIRALGMEARVLLYEGVPHQRICAFFEKASIFVLPSREEPFGIVLLEAGAMNVPVVASRVGGIPEIVVDNESGCLVEPEDSDRLAARLVELMDNPEMRARLAQNLNQRVRDLFTWRRTCDAYFELVR